MMIDDSRLVTVSQVLLGADGTVDEVTHLDRAAPSADPAIRSRFVSRGGGSTPSEVVTEFEPSAERPASYPAALPFLPGLRTHTTEFPDGEHAPGARWECPDPEPVVAALVQQSVAEGWLPVEGVVTLPMPAGATMRRLERGGTTRMLNTVSMEAMMPGLGAIVQLQDAPSETARRAATFAAGFDPRNLPTDDDLRRMLRDAGAGPDSLV